MAGSGPQPPAPSSQALPSLTAAQSLHKAWQSRGVAAWVLWPVSCMYRALVAFRRWLYRAGILSSSHPGRPVIVVGNVIAGGAGKTPVVIELVRYLQARGLRVGVISRGYGRKTTGCREVLADSPASEVGDEPALMARNLSDGGATTPLFVARQRTEAARALLAAYPETQMIVCDDGLQHLALRRDVEVCIFNNQGVGNGFLLPAGPLREPWPRPTDLVLYAGDAPPRSAAPSFRMERHLADFALRADGSRVPLQDLQGQPMHAVAAVARPADFFAMLQTRGLTLARTEALPDHYNFDSWQRLQDNRQVLICTEKDAVKLWPRHPDALAVPLQLHIDSAFFAALDAHLPT
ncbi:tetraacyldisaccharide 4'-kinase [Acidovorax sp. sic0104]|uniref:tetraacyldisaccharide 4'-kinase n=1 Tax=Acidovorax sp. sic0104 TaxID=2854784 RepID=UPI001C485B70|nr:tetraacyldisaccharide 4'-kinase [Acidovorax sp. sic0104]MBV7544536.1 tetraacyldisaccharide 4'-kinase [Acidovorax sp. sic0104]